MSASTKQLDLSIVIPAYNASATIERCIESVVLQAKELKLKYEVLVVDDGSSDDTAAKIQALAKKNKNIILIQQENAGPSKARNTGMKAARGMFIALNDSDDEWLEGKLKAQMEYFMHHTDVDLVCSQYSDTCRSTKPVKVNFDMEMFHNYFSCQTSLFKRSIADEILFPEDMKYSEDMRFFLMVLMKYRCHYVPVPATKSITGKMQFGDSGLSSQLWKMEKGELSNLSFAYKNKQISFWTFCKAVIYSLAKYFRRCILSAKNRKTKK